MDNQPIDKHFRVEVLNKSLDPERTIYLAMHQDYSENFVWDEWTKQQDTDYSHSEWEKFDWKFTSDFCGSAIVNNLLKGGRGHYGPLEHPQIVLNCGWFPHSTMQQVRTHRVGISFDCQSFRYTGDRIRSAATPIRKRLGIHAPTLAEIQDAMHDDLIIQEALEQVFYLRPLGCYTDRKGHKYEYTQFQRISDLALAGFCAVEYDLKMEKGFSEEHARSLIPFDVRQHWVVSANVRSLMHLLDLRWKKDAQLEAQQLCELIWPHFQSWVPHVAAWYEENRKGKARLAP